MPLNDRQIRSLLVACRETQPEELDCEEFLVDVAQYAETVVSGRPVPDALAKAEAHVRLCANCAEECATLVELLRAEQKAAG